MHACMDRHHGQMLLKKSKTPTQHMRAVLQTASDFSSAVTALSSSPLIDQGYYIVGGAAPGQGAVIARARDKVISLLVVGPIR